MNIPELGEVNLRAAIPAVVVGAVATGVTAVAIFSTGYGGGVTTISHQEVTACAGDLGTITTNRMWGEISAECTPFDDGQFPVVQASSDSATTWRKVMTAKEFEHKNAQKPENTAQVRQQNQIMIVMGIGSVAGGSTYWLIDRRSKKKSKNEPPEPEPTTD